MRNAFYFTCFGIILFLSTHKISGQTLTYNPSVVVFYADSNEINNLKASLDSFFATKNDDRQFNRFWDSSDYQTYRFPYIEIYWSEYSAKYQDENFYKPHVISIKKLITGYSVKIAYIGKDEAETPIIRSIYNIIGIKQEDGSFKFKRATEEYTKNWKRYRIGNINYVVNPSKELNKTRALALDSFNNKLAATLKKEPIIFTYYFCENPEDLFHVKGYDYTFQMYYDTTGGMIEISSPIVYAANNSEYYPHEVVHLYLQKYWQTSNFIIAEGLPTYLGGSGEISLTDHLHHLKQYLLETNITNVDSLLIHDQDIGASTSTYYALSGLVCKLIYEKKGIEGIMELASVGGTHDDPYTACYNKAYELLGIKNEEWNSYLYDEVMKY